MTRTANLQLVTRSAATVDEQVTLVVPTENIEPDPGTHSLLVASRPPTVGSGNVTATCCLALSRRSTPAGHISDVAGPSTVTTGEGAVGVVSLQAAATLTSPARHNPNNLRNRMFDPLKTNA